MHPTFTAAGLCAFMAMTAAARADHPSCWVYFGTSAVDANRGIYLSKLDQETGSLTAARRVADKADSVFFAFSPDKGHLYGLFEIRRPGVRPIEALETYAVDAATGALAPAGEEVPGGTEACHISVDPSGRCVLTANYDEAYVEVFPILTGGLAGARSSVVHFSGSGPDKSRQASAHAHSINTDPTGRFAVVCDLGQDKLFVYRLDAAKGLLTPNDPPYAQVAPGSGPRHFAFHPDGRHAFVINELAATITAFTWDGEKGILALYQTVPILRKDYSGSTNTSAEVVVGKDGRFVYGSNRGDDSLVVHSFDPATGNLTFVQRMAEGIQVPRNFAIDPSGKWLVCANLTANSATVYQVDQETGKLRLSGSIDVPQPLCVRFLQAR
jgi:6-phosphogluconolactonase